MVTTGPGSPHGQGDINNSWAECGNWDHNSEAPSAPREVGGEEREELEHSGARGPAGGGRGSCAIRPEAVPRDGVAVGRVSCGDA